MSERLWRAVRAPLSRAMVGPFRRARMSDFLKAAPSSSFSVNSTDGSIFSKTRRATGRPARIPSSLARRTASERASAGMMLSEVISPSGMSSRSAASIIWSNSRAAMAKVIDIHVHFGAPGKNGAPIRGCYWSEKFETSPAYWAMRVITGSILGAVDFDRVKNRIFKTIDSSKKVDQCVLLALDQVYNEQGQNNITEWTNLYVDNSAIVELANSNPRVLFGASVHPYRPNWPDALDYCLAHKAVLCKWLPSSLCIDPP